MRIECGMILRVCLVTVCLGWNAAQAANNDRLMEAARSAGLHVQWYGQVETDPRRDQVIDVELHVSSDQATNYFEITYGNNREVISEYDRNSRGEVLGVGGAAQKADLRREILEAEGYSVSVSPIAIPRTTLYAMTNDGIVHAIDAENGKTIWTSRVGKRLYPSEGIAVNDDHLVAVKGTSVYCFNAKTGDLIWTRPTRTAPGGGVALSDQFAYVTQVGGIVEVYPLNETGIPSQYFVSVGNAANDPVVTDLTVSWPTDIGHYNVANVDEVKTISYKLNTGGVSIVASGAASGNNLIVNSITGKVFAIDEQSGKIAWEIATGDRITKAPVAIGNGRVLIITEQDNLMAVEGATGLTPDGWPAVVPNISQYVAGSQNHLYFVDSQKNLLGIRRDNGAVGFRIALGENMLMLTNTQTDRLYVGDETGRLICLREISSFNPMFHAGDEPMKPEDPSRGQRNPFDTGEADPADAGDPAKPANPFDTKPNENKPKNPFDTGGDKKSGGNNPFDRDN